MLLEEELSNHKHRDQEEDCVPEIHVIDQVCLTEVIDKLIFRFCLVSNLEHWGYVVSYQQVQFDCVNEQVERCNCKHPTRFAFSANSPVKH